MEKMLYSHHALLPYFAYIPTTIVVMGRGLDPQDLTQLGLAE